MIPNLTHGDFDADVVVVGGGLAGLTAATTAANAGRSVILLEKAKRPGGLAVTDVRRGAYFNLGPRALYRNGLAFEILTHLGVPFTGHVPNTGRTLALLDGALAALPATVGGVLTTGMLTVREKWRFARLLARIDQIDAAAVDHVPLSQWIHEQAGDGNLAMLLRFLFRISTYADEPDLLSAGAALRQLQIAHSGNVLYLDGGWQTLVEGLTALARNQGVEIRSSAPAESVQPGEEGVTIRLRSGDVLTARTAILAAPPQSVSDLLKVEETTSFGQSLAACRPVQAACLDVALTHLPRPERRAVFGLDRPYYYSVHSAAAKLAPPGVAVIHVMKYLGRSTAPAEQVHAELRQFLEQVQPGWQSHVVTQRFLPRMTVSSILPLAERGGLAGRPRVANPETPRVFLAGDWVGADGMLADAAMASGQEAARRAVALTSHRFAAVERRSQHVNG